MPDDKKEVTPFDPNRLKEALQERVRQQFLEVIPEDQWDAMIQKEIEAFFVDSHYVKITEEEKKQPGYYNSHKTYTARHINMTPFRSMVYEELWKLVSKRLQDALTEEKFFATVMPDTLSTQDVTGSNDLNVIMGGEVKMDEFFKSIMESMAPIIVREMFSSFFAQTADQVRQMLQNRSTQL